MNKEQIKKAILDYIGETEASYKHDFSMSGELINAWNLEASYRTNLFIDEIEEYYRQVIFGSSKLGKMIIMDTSFYMGENLDEFIDNMLKIKAEGDELEAKIILK